MMKTDVSDDNDSALALLRQPGRGSNGGEKAKKHGQTSQNKRTINMLQVFPASGHALPRWIAVARSYRRGCLDARPPALFRPGSR